MHRDVSSHHVIRSCGVVGVASLALALGAGAGCKQQPDAISPHAQTGFHSWRLLPPDAELAASGAPPLSMLARPGEAYYVLDETAGYLVSSGRLPEDAQLLVVVDKRQKTVFGKTSPDAESMPLAEGINPGHRYSIWHSAASASGAQMETAPGAPTAPTTQPRPMR